jgi:hypothetical protein
MQRCFARHVCQLRRRPAQGWPWNFLELQVLVMQRWQVFYRWQSNMQRMHGGPVPKQPSLKQLRFV